MKDEDEMILLRVAYSVTFRVRFLETDMGTFENATVTAKQSNVFYFRRNSNIKNHIIEQLENCAQDDELIDVRVLRTEEVD